MHKWKATTIKYKDPAGLTNSFDNAVARIIGTQGGVVLVGFAPGTPCWA